MVDEVLKVDGAEIAISSNPMVFVKLLAAYYIADIDFGEAKGLGQLLEMVFLGRTSIKTSKKKNTVFAKVDKFYRDAFNQTQ